MGADSKEANEARDALKEEFQENQGTFYTQFKVSKCREGVRSSKENSRVGDRENKKKKCMRAKTFLHVGCEKKKKSRGTQK